MRLVSAHEIMRAMTKSQDDEMAEANDKSRLTKVIQGGTVFIVMFVVLYVTLRRLTNR